MDDKYINNVPSLSKNAFLAVLEPRGSTDLLVVGIVNAVGKAELVVANADEELTS